MTAFNTLNGVPATGNRFLLRDILRTEWKYDGVVVSGQAYPLDCIIYATGFDFLMEFSRESGLDVVGRDGIDLRDHWREGPRTLYAVQTDHFPNFFLLRLSQAGNSPNYTLTVEEQSSYIVDVIAACLKSGAATVEATEDAAHEEPDLTREPIALEREERGVVIEHGFAVAVRSEEHEADHAAGVIAAGGRYQVRDPGGSCHLRAADSGSTPAGAP